LSFLPKTPTLCGMNTPAFPVGDSLNAATSGWHFGGQTPEVFGTHIRRSVPNYEAGHRLITALSDFFVKPDSTCYELGCSLGELIGQLARHHQAKPHTRWIGIDNEPAMIAKAQTRLADYPLPNVSFVCQDALSVPWEKSDFIVAYYTVQFIHPRVRQTLISQIYDTLNWGGAFILFEKVRGPDARFQDIFSTLYTDFKLENGFSPDEIVGKTQSLKGVLEPFSTQGNLDLLTRAGFKDVTTVMKHLCFEGFLAIK
jgi:tRNA (cmo5U34)-methyltransferase